MYMSADYVIALAGNPNTGKSTVFNALTGLRQHTGNWPGKTVLQATGHFNHGGLSFELVDLPGTYSLLADSPEEEIARDFICFARPAVTVIVVDATALERNLNLVLQITEITAKVILCLNLMDEAKRLHLRIDLARLETELGIPVVPTAATSGEGLPQLRDAIKEVATGLLSPRPRPLRYTPFVESRIEALLPHLDDVPACYNKRWAALRLLAGAAASGADGDRTMTDRQKIKDSVTASTYARAEQIAGTVLLGQPSPGGFSERLDRVVTSKTMGFPLMLALLVAALWLTIFGADYPSDFLARVFFGSENLLTGLFMKLNSPAWLHGALVLGGFRGLAWVIAVMLPPMAIFFPIFTYLEDFGYLPRIAFNLDHLFRKAGAHGKQALTMAMGFGCNAAGVISARIINSPRERLVAILTNSFIPCNGRFPFLIIMGTILVNFIVPRPAHGLWVALAVTAAVFLALSATFLVSRLLTATLLKGEASFFFLELPPYRRPRCSTVLLRSFLDRTFPVLLRAVIVAAPAGVITWVLANVTVGNATLIAHCAGRLDPLARAIGLDGVILLSFILGLPANEIVIPIMLMGYLSEGALVQFSSVAAIRELLALKGWTWLTALNFIVFSVFHWPCGTTLLTVKRETGSWKWTFYSAFLPTILGVILCFLLTKIASFYLK